MMKLAVFYITILVHASVTCAFVSNNLNAFHKRLDTKLYGEVSDEMHENFRKLGFRKPKPIRRSAVSNQNNETNARKTFQASIKNAYQKPIPSARQKFQASIKNAYHRQMKTPKPIIRRTAVGPRDEESIRDRIMNSFRRPCDVDIKADINITTEYYELEFLIDKK
ncbi:predicted protein [Chaetoceros tenuissimus]|uniref:Uncharacterized protein n=1 Tax=Chaetoceros tenuissimus TaxID=426638 RepID=A0AAD3CE20_9STRA|nr:predicted protein [Chaetoceros tenuissimus]